MNKTERKMVEILTRGRENFGVVSVKAEFEAEGTRLEELLRLVDVARASGLPMTVKIGGCEAIRDLLEAKQIGVRYIVAPMVETPYALSKFLGAISIAFNKDERENTDFLFNLETITAFENLDEMLALASSKPGCDGVVFGRVDFSGSIGVGRNGIESERVTASVEAAARACLERDLQFVVGGAVSIGAFENLQRFKAIHLDRFETRKVVFNGAALDSPNLAIALRQAVHFELLWLINKREHYGLMHHEDEARIEMLESRWKVLDDD